MLQTTRALNSRLTAFGAPLVALHSQLVFPLARNGHVREFVLNPFSHNFHFLCLLSGDGSTIRIPPWWPSVNQLFCRGPRGRSCKVISPQQLRPNAGRENSHFGLLDFTLAKVSLANASCQGGLNNPALHDD